MSAGARKAKLALVIGSGGIKCAASIGVMQVLEEEGIRPDMIVGCSGGAVFGAGIAMGNTAAQVNEIQARTWTSKLTSRLDFRSLAGTLAPGLFGFDESFSIFDSRIMADNLVAAYGEGTTFADLAIPFYCVATDFHSGKSVVITEGLLAEAVRASSGIPLVFGAVAVGGRMLIDGALSNPLPVEVAMKEGADVILAVGFETTMAESVSSIGQFAGQMFYILINQLMRKKLAFYGLAHHSEIIMILPDFGERIGVSAIGRVPEIIALGAAETRLHMNYLKRLLNR